MKKLILLFVLISNIAFSQIQTEKKIYDVVSYNELISFYNQKFKLNNETLEQNIERCKYIVSESEKSGNYESEIAFKIILTGLSEAKETLDKEGAFITIYQDDSSFNFYDSKGKFKGRVLSEKFTEDKSTENLLKEYFYLIQE